MCPCRLRPLVPGGVAVSPVRWLSCHTVIGRRRISRFLNNLARPHVTQQDLAAGYAAMAADEADEQEAEAWAEALIGDVADEPSGR